MSANVEAMIRAGIDAFRAGNKADARTLLERAIELDEYNEMAWLWLSAVVETPEEQRTCLENVLVINPNSERAKQGLKSLGIDPDTLRPPEPAESNPSASAFNFDSADDLFGDADFGMSSNPSTGGTGGFVMDTGPVAPADALSNDDYDNWVGGLNLGKKAEAPEEVINQTNPFGAFDFDDPNAIFGDDSDFDTGVQAPLQDAGESFGDSTNPFGDLRLGDDDLESSDFATGANSPFSDRTFESAILEQADETEFEELFEENTQSPAQPDEVFLQIPPEIMSASRLPGMDEQLPRRAFILTSLLILLNGGALGFLVLQILT